MEGRIPRVIHYCWFGRKPKSELMLKCIESWKEKLSEYEIIEWNEDNFAVDMLEYTKQAYEAKKYAFVSDYVRLWVLYNYGGIYMDTDVEVIKNLDCFLGNQGFMGFEGDHGVNPGLIIGSIKKQKLIYEIMNIYEKSFFINSNNNHNITTIVHNATKILLSHGLILDSSLKQNIDNMIIYPKNYFCPDKEMRDNNIYLDNTYTAHHYDGSWLSKEHKNRLKSPVWKLIFYIIAKFGRMICKILGERAWKKFRNKYFQKTYDFVRGQ